jgi:hypothetical protein
MSFVENVKALLGLRARGRNVIEGGKGLVTIMLFPSLKTAI